MEQGGATVFPNIEKAVFPKTGTAVLWYNLKHDGKGDTQTLHAACPVIVGSKWGKYFVSPSCAYIYGLPDSTSQCVTSGYANDNKCSEDPVSQIAKTYNLN